MNTKPTRATGSHLYKYSSAANLKHLRPVILENELYFPRPSELNDPAEGKPKLIKTSIQGIITFLCDKYAVRNPGLSEIDYRRAREEIADIVNRSGEDNSLKIMSKILNSILLDNHRIYSLSKRYDNMSLWAKYTDNFKGYCLEFLNDGLFRSAYEVIYTNNPVTIDVTNPETIKAHFFFMKKNDWSNEEEVRIVTPSGWQPPYKFDATLLTKIILGKNMPKTDEVIIKKWAEKRSPALEVVRVEYDETEHKLFLVKI